MNSKKFEVKYPAGEPVIYWADRMEPTGAGVAFYNDTMRQKVVGNISKLVALIAPGWESVKEIPLTNAEKAYEDAIFAAADSNLKHNKAIADARKAVEDERGTRE